MRISDWSSDVCSSDLEGARRRIDHQLRIDLVASRAARHRALPDRQGGDRGADAQPCARIGPRPDPRQHDRPRQCRDAASGAMRSEERTSELQSLMRSSYAVFCLKKKKKNTTTCAN